MYKVEEFDNAKMKVLKYVLYKKRTEYEIKTKFSKVFEETLLEDIIEYLKEAEYIDDKKYIEKTVNNYIALNNLSLKEVKYKLITKGTNKNDLEEYFYDNKEELEEYEIKSAINIYNKKIVSMEQDEIETFLLKKGYKKENIKTAISRLENEE